MAQVVATRSIQTSLLCPNSRSLQLNPSTLASRVFFPRENNTTTSASRIVAMRSARAEPELIPVSPEDVPKVCAAATTTTHRVIELLEVANFESFFAILFV